MKELIVDNFAGGGGASTGIEQAIGRSVDIAINHDPEAIAMHKVNHPNTKHYCESVWDVDPIEVTAGKPVGLAWFSPDCKHFSKAKGGTPVSKKIRGLAWIVMRWAAKVKPRVIMLENVEEFKTWGPLITNKDGNNYPDPNRKGETFKSFVSQLERLGYTVEWKELRASDYGVPTIRKRLFLIARCDGRPIKWPGQTHGNPEILGSHRLIPWRTAAEAIDFSLDCPSIFERKKPLAEATCKRIAKGIMRYVIDSDKPFIINSQMNAKDNSLHVAAFLAKNYTGVVGSSLTHPIGTVTAVDHHSLVTSHLVQLRNSQFGKPVTEPIPTITAGGLHLGEVRAFLTKFYGNDKDGSELTEPLHTVTTKDRFGLVTVHGTDYQIVDIGLRMLQPHELYAAQGFPSDYIIDYDIDGKPITKKSQVARCGNSVCPPLAKLLVECNLPEFCAVRYTA